jgi:hypothetical protein
VFANTSTVSVNPYANTIYTVTASDGTCAGTATVALATKTTPTITAAASNTQICEGDNTVLNATGATSYEWMPGSLSGSTHTVSPATSTLYIVTGTNNVGCYSSANVVVLVYPPPTVTATTNKTLVCQSDAAVLSAGGASTYVWTNGPSSSSYTVNPQNSDTYTVTGTDQYGCVNTQTVSVWVYLPIINVSATPTAVCTGSTVSLSASTPSGTGYSWNGTPGQNVQLTPSATTVYVVTATSASNNVICPATNSIQVVVNPNPNVTATANKTVMCKGDAVAIITGSGATTYTWNNAATTATIAASNLGSNSYTVNATDANGCKGKASIFIQVNQCVGISEASANVPQVLIYPNPTSGEFVITGERAMKLSIMSETGQLVKTADLTADNQYSAKVSDLPAGLYLITSEGNIAGKVIITK